MDRCLYMSPENCPTRNGFAVMTMIHHLPELAEHFIVLEDDTMFGRSVTHGDFFAAPSGKPLVFQVRIYIMRERCSTLKLHVLCLSEVCDVSKYSENHLTCMYIQLSLHLV